MVRNSVAAFLAGNFCLFDGILELLPGGIAEQFVQFASAPVILAVLIYMLDRVEWRDVGRVGMIVH
jgi:hypothetical protein